MNVLTCVVLLIGVLANTLADQETKESVQIIDHPHKNEYTSMVAGSDKHKYGYELKENKHFHHTTTETDGVRLGCYGYILEGKKYSTQYVADIKGYRPVSTHDAITVYPKSGGERQASFVGDFNEDEARSQNIRYFFPDGCKGIEVKIPISEMPPPLRSVIPVTDQPILIPANSDVPPVSVITQNTGQTPPPTFFLPPFLPVESKPIAIISTTTTQAPTTKVTSPPTTTTVRTTTPEETKPPTTTPVPTMTPVPTTTPVPKTTPEVVTNPPTSPPTDPPTTVAVTTPRPTPPLLTKIPVPFNSLLRNPPTPNLGRSENTCCCDDDSAKLILPISMKHLVQEEGSCGSYAKLIIPVEGLNPDSLRSLTRSPDATNELLRSVLQSLSKH